MIVRKSLLALMKKSSSKDLPDPIEENGRPTFKFWLETDKSTLLRPGWELDWADNEIGWVVDAAEKIQECGTRWCGGMSPEDLRLVPLADIISAIHTTFSSWKRAYRLSNAEPKDQNQERRAHRRSQRKIKVSRQLCAMETNLRLLRLGLGHVQKAALRRKYRHTIPELAAAKFDFLFETVYQSTDESVSENDGAVQASAIDPDTSDDNWARTAKRSVNATVPRRRNLPAI